MTSTRPTGGTPAAPAVTVSQDDAAAVLSVMRSLSGAWAGHDAETMAKLYTDDATLILPGVTYLKGRAAISDYMDAAFAGKWKGTRVAGVPLELRYAADDVIVLVSQGGAYRPGSAEVTAEDAIRGMWLFTRRDGQWAISGYVNTPLGAAVPLPDTAG
ncbi:SgcJ/EcaC family oxidoreductase [Microbispora amethystogenes]|uniref:SgcJ/EcaC family oxidoreductase n=1 Tax=Microbispora amethystogenes TaxID=1427754 RepID=UPI0033F7EDA3